MNLSRSIVRFENGIRLSCFKISICYPGITDRAEKRLRMRVVDSFLRVFDRLINESLVV